MVSLPSGFQSRAISLAAVATACLLAWGLTTGSAQGQAINASLASDFTISQIIVGGPSTSLPFNVSIDAQVGK